MLVAVANLKTNFIAVNDRLDENLFLGRKLEGMNERSAPAASGIGASDVARPQPGNDDGGVLALGDGNLRIKMPDDLGGARLQHLTVVANVLGKPVGALPSAVNFLIGRRMKRGHIFEGGGDFDHRLVDDDGDGIEIGGEGFEPETLSLERDGAAAGKGIEDGGQIVADGFFDLVERLGEYVVVGAVFPLDDVLDDLIEAIAFGFLSFGCWK